VEDVATPAVSTSVELDNRLRAVQKKFDETTEQARKKLLFPDRPPPGKIEVLATDVDEKGQTWITRFVNRFGNIENKQIGQLLLVRKRASRR
jgi:hypothetical protein